MDARNSESVRQDAADGGRDANRPDGGEDRSCALLLWSRTSAPMLACAEFSVEGQVVFVNDDDSILCVISCFCLGMSRQRRNEHPVAIPLLRHSRGHESRSGCYAAQPRSIRPGIILSLPSKPAVHPPPPMLHLRYLSRDRHLPPPSPTSAIASSSWRQNAVRNLAFCLSHAQTRLRHSTATSAAKRPTDSIQTQTDTDFNSGSTRPDGIQRSDAPGDGPQQAITTVDFMNGSNNNNFNVGLNSSIAASDDHLEVGEAQKFLAQPDEASWTTINSDEYAHIQEQWWHDFRVENDLLGERREYRSAPDARDACPSPTLNDVCTCVGLRDADRSSCFYREGHDDDAHHQPRRRSLRGDSAPLVTCIAKPVWLGALGWDAGANKIVDGTVDEMERTVAELWQVHLTSMTNSALGWKIGESYLSPSSNKRSPQAPKLSLQFQKICATDVLSKDLGQLHGRCGLQRITIHDKSTNRFHTKIPDMSTLAELEVESDDKDIVAQLEGKAGSVNEEALRRWWHAVMTRILDTQKHDSGGVNAASDRTRQGIWSDELAAATGVLAAIQKMRGGRSGGKEATHDNDNTDNRLKRLLWGAAVGKRAKIVNLQ
ncbi:hypothetical protein HDU83_005872 [Entophlyctis luteolus]|nr:hypothetical protein HDU83_005872 [Entophlyctis luteolus]